MSPLILRESDQKIDRATRKKKYETARMVEEESSVQHTGRWKRKEERKGMLGNRWNGFQIQQVNPNRMSTSMDIYTLSIQSIDSSEKMPVVEDSELSLACITQGSSAMQVRWFKDDAAINVQTSYRSMWTTLVPKNSKDQYTAILGFEKAHVLDSVRRVLFLKRLFSGDVVCLYACGHLEVKGKTADFRVKSCIIIPVPILSVAADIIEIVLW
ncbi:ig-like domain-containing protein [Caerostris darwini]|uniref:Ig-like domain-containing protein n=2 Tax=Caerostris TaxID=172845 RepID=A0AAV4QYD9_9ARAC|nr:ig-like domain-containing protein [Caerostris darwini]